MDMSYHNLQQPGIGVPLPQGYPPNNNYLPPGFSVQGYPSPGSAPPPQQNYTPPPAQPPPHQQPYPPQGYAPATPPPSSYAAPLPAQQQPFTPQDYSSAGYVDPLYTPLPVQPPPKDYPSAPPPAGYPPPDCVSSHDLQQSPSPQKNTGCLHRWTRCLEALCCCCL